MNIPNYELVEKIYESEKTLVLRAFRQQDKRAMVLKILKGDNRSAEQLVRYRQGYEITRLLSNTEGVIKAYGIEKFKNTLMICMEDFGGHSLRMLQAQRTFSLAELLAFAIQASKILGDIHSHHIIHKDLNPANLLVNPDTGELKVIDFGISTQLSKQHLTLQNPEALEGTLAYISPEQTGRMNRSLDYRTDFYSLGATFYELFTGRLPFETQDVLALMHCHIAKQPIAPHEVNPEVPLAISKIIMKLLEKTAEARYQSSWGIKADLEACQRQLMETGQMTEFSLGQHDFSVRFQLLQKLYGRESEIDLLLAGFERVAAGNREMMLTVGYSGIGKSALVKEIYKSLTEKRGYFISGKFDQLQRSIPYSAVINAFKELVQQLLTENAQNLTIWKAKLLAVLGLNGQVIIDLVPELEQIIGQQPPVAQLGATESQNRFNLVLQNFMHVFCQAGHPLVIFLDDLQWADSATLQLLEKVMVDQGNTSLYLLGAYRDNEVHPTHPLMTSLDKLHDDNVLINQITLKPLAIEHISQLIADSLQHSVDAVGPLADLVMRKTDGNPFFINQFLYTLYEEELLTLAAQNQAWSWDIAQIEAMNIMDNVVDLMVTKLEKLPCTAQNILRLAACIGNAFDLDTLSVIYEKPIAETFQALMPVLNDEFILPVSSLELSHGEIQHAPMLIRHFTFAHDRVQQAAYALIDEVQKQVMHLQIGRLLLKNTPDLALKIFDIVGHFNNALELLKNSDERLKLAELNLMAGQKAKLATAYGVADKYFAIGRQCLPENSWACEYHLTLNFFIEAAETAYLNSDFASMAQLAHIVLQNVQTITDATPIFSIQLNAYIAQNQHQTAINMALDLLQQLDIQISTQPTQEQVGIALHTLQAKLSERSIHTLVELPRMTDKRLILIMSLLKEAITVAHHISPKLAVLLNITTIELSLSHGIAVESIPIYTHYGCILCSVANDIESGYQFGLLSLELLKRLDKQAENRIAPQMIAAQNCHVFNSFIRIWKEHVTMTLPALSANYQAGLEAGTIKFAAYSIEMYSIYAYFTGQSLATLETEMTVYSQDLTRLKLEDSVNRYMLYHQVVLNLVEETNTPCSLIGKVYNADSQLLSYQKINDSIAIHFLYIFRSILNYLFEQYATALENIIIAEQHVESVTGQLTEVIFYFYDSLIQLARYPELSPAKQETVLAKITANQQKMQHWALYAPMNYQHKYALVEAEKARVLGQLEAIEWYEKAIAGARENEYINEEALAYELAAKFYLNRGMEKFAHTYLNEAYYAYQRWGANAKVKDLETRYPYFLSTKLAETISTKQTTSISTTSSTQWLDLNSIMKAAQTLSGEIVLEQLLEKMMRIVIENAGAEKGFLLLPQGEQWFIEAEGHINHNNVNVLQAVLVQEGVNLPVSLVTYVARTQESLVLNNASTDGLLIRDSYIKQHQTKSVIGLPLTNQDQLIGILYLENNLTTDAFTAERLETLNLLSAQLAISIQNAKLYAEIQTKERTLTQFLEAVPVGIGILDHLGQVYFINQTGQQWLGKGIVKSSDLQSHSQTYQLYVAGSEQFYPDEQLSIARALQGERAHTDDIEIRHAERTIPIEAWSAPIYDQQGNIIYAITTFLDITERRQAEADKLRLVQEQEAKNAALHYSAEIEAKNTELAATLQQLRETQNQLVEAEKMASLGNLVAGVAHEINTPVGIGVTAVTQLDSLTLDFVKRYKDGKMARSDLEQYLNAVHQTSGLILKNLTRAAELTKSFKSIAVDQSSDEQQTFMLRDYINEVVTSLKPKFDNTEYQVSVECDANLQLITSPGALAQILTNLIINSLQHGFAGRDQGHIHITAQHHAQAVQLHYRDDGKGIAPDIIEKIYEPFFTTDRAGGGSGLGMHIVYNLITHKLHGTIECESVLGDGVCFTFDLPLSVNLQ